MSISDATLSEETANGARQDLEELNQKEISDAKDKGRPQLLVLKKDKALPRLEKALTEFRAAFKTHHPNATIGYASPVICVLQPLTKDLGTMDGVYGCLALGKLGGGEAKELKLGRAFVWRPGETHAFGDVDAIYVGFKVDGDID